MHLDNGVERRSDSRNARPKPFLEVVASVPFDVFAHPFVSPISCANDADHFGSKGKLSAWSRSRSCFGRFGIRWLLALLMLMVSASLMIVQCGSSCYHQSPKRCPRDSTLGYPGEGPVRVLAKLGDLSLHVMIDSGSDYNAINADLALLQERAKNAAFGGRRNLQPESIGGYAEGLNKVVSQASRWTVTLTGYHDDDTWFTKPVEQNIAEEFHEVLGLNDPLILGNPWLDKYGPLTIDKNAVFLNDVWMERTDRAPPRELSPHELRICSMSSCLSSVVDDAGWYPVDVVVDGFQDLSLALDRYPVWVEGSNLYDNLCILESRLSKERGDSEPTADSLAKTVSAANKGRITVLVSAMPGHVVRLLPFKPLAVLRWEEPDDTKALNTFCESVASQSQTHQTGQISTAKYKMRQKTDAQTKLFPQLLEEIDDRRRHLEQVQPKDVHSEAYKSELMQICTDQNLVPEAFRDRFFQQIIRPFSDCFWIDGAPAPEIKGFKASIAPKKDAVFKAGQPYRLSRFDEARLSFLIEEEVVEGKLEPLGPNDPVPPMVTPTFVVDKKGSLVGRRVGDFRELNQNTEEYYYPAPDAEAILSRATGQKFHSTLDCVWGFSGLACDEDTSLLLSVITPAGVFKTKKLPFGPKQGPAIYQSVQERIFGSAFKPDGSPLVDIFVDDSHLGDDDDDAHFASLIQLLKLARQYGLQYRLSKCVFFQPECVLLGNVVGRHGRRPDPKKVSQLKDWPSPKSCADIMSFLAFANYLRMYLGPRFVDKSMPLRKYTKKGSDFSMYAHDAEAQKAFQDIKGILVERAVLYAPDWEAAAYPWRSARPFEVYIDASDHSYCAVLCQRPAPHMPPRPIAFFAKSFDEVATRWSAFEREFFAFREGMHALHKYVDGFPVYAFFDHHNVERAEAVLKSRRASKKLVAWIADAQPLLANTMRVWIAGKDNILADSGSRAPWADAVAKNLPVPEQSILETIESFFTDPTDLAEKVEQRTKTMKLSTWVPMDVNLVPGVWIPRAESFEGLDSVARPPQMPRIPEQCSVPMSVDSSNPSVSSRSYHTAHANSTSLEGSGLDSLDHPTNDISVSSSSATTSSSSSSSGFDARPSLRLEGHHPRGTPLQPAAETEVISQPSAAAESFHAPAPSSLQAPPHVLPASAQVSQPSSASSSDFTRSRSRHASRTSDFELPSVSDITRPQSDPSSAVLPLSQMPSVSDITNPTQGSLTSELWPASQLPSASDITTPFHTPNLTDTSSELLPAGALDQTSSSEQIPVYSDSEPSSSTVTMSSDTLLDAVAPSLKSYNPWMVDCLLSRSNAKA